MRLTFVQGQNGTSVSDIIGMAQKAHDNYKIAESELIDRYETGRSFIGKLWDLFNYKIIAPPHWLESNEVKRIAELTCIPYSLTIEEETWDFIEYWKDK